MKAKALFVIASALIVACSSAPGSEPGSSDTQGGPDDPDAARSGWFGGGTAADAGYGQDSAANHDAAHDAAAKSYADVASPPVCPKPADVSGFIPGPSTPPRTPDKTACQSGDYQAYYDACQAMTATAKSCQAWETAHTKCFHCIVSTDADAQWGLIVEAGAVASINVAGCLELVGDHGCAVAYANVEQCQAAGCKVQCPVTDTPSFTLYQQCISTVTAGGCKKYDDASNVACAPNASPNAGKCTDSGEFQGLLVKLGPVFCGP